MKPNVSLLNMVLILCLSFIYGHARAQETQTGKKKSFAERFREELQKNKDKLEQVNKGKQPTNQTTGGNASISLNGSHFLEGGKISENVVYVDADRWYAFNKGAAVIGKGNTHALINAKGTFILPYASSYQLIAGNASALYAIDQRNRVTRHPYYVNGIFEFLANTAHPDGGFMDHTGRVISPRSETNKGLNYNLTVNGRYIYARRSTGTQKNAGVNYSTYTTVVVTADGKAIAFPYDVNDINEDIGIATHPATGQKAFIGLSGKLLTEFIYREAYPFSDGMAIVGNPDAYGQMKYGAVNNLGQLVIPLTYSIKPEDFSGGFAQVQPKDKTQAGFSYGYVDKTGKLMGTFSDEQTISLGKFGPFSPYGMAFSGRNVLNKDFRIMSKADFFSSYGLPADCFFSSHSEGTGSWAEGESNNKIFYSHNKIKDTRTAFGMLIGFINLETGKVVKPSFAKIGQFDPVSKLAYAEAIRGVTQHKQPILRKGYINEEGVFVLLEARKPAW